MWMHVLSLILIVLAVASWLCALKGLQLPRPRSVKHWSFCILALLSSVLLLLRPDEELEAGEDPSVYVHVGLRLFREGRFTFSDPALAEVPEAYQSAFRYGHAAFRSTKDVSFWARGEDPSEVGIWFQPAPSLLLGLPAAWFGPYAAFLVSPLIAMACGLLLAALCRRLFHSDPVGWMAYALYLLHPVILWNARTVRAEWGAAWLSLSALCIWWQGITRDEKGTALQGALSGLALGCALLFHMTVSYVLLPMLFCSAMRTRMRPFWWAWWGGVSFGVLMLVLQTLFVTDPYWIKPMLVDPDRNLLVLLGLVLFVILAMCCRFLGHSAVAPSLTRWIVWVLPPFLGAALLYIALFLTERGTLPLLPDWSAAYISLTDVRGVGRVMNPLLALLSLWGLWEVWRRHADARWLILVWLPAALCIGWMHMYMFETRRMIAFLIPLMLLGTLSALRLLQSWLEIRGRSEWWLSLGLLVLVALPLWQRQALITTWNNRGSYAFYREIAKEVEDGDVLMGEYTQTLVPVASLADLPSLPFSWEYRDDGERDLAETYARMLLQTDPDKTVYWLSPFPGATIPGLGLKALGEYHFKRPQLQRGRHAIPHTALRHPRRLYLSQLLPASHPEATQAELVREVNGSRFGIRGTAEVLSRSQIRMQGLNFPKGESLKLEAGRYQIFLAHPGGRKGSSLLEESDSFRSVGLGSYFECIHVHTDEAISLQFRRSLFVTDLYELSGSELKALPLPGELQLFELGPLNPQWMRAESMLALPQQEQGTRIWTLAAAGRDLGESGLNVDLETRNGMRLAEMQLSSGWSWQAVDLPPQATADGRAEWLKLRCEAYDPENPDFSQDLGFLLHLVYIPSEKLPELP